MKNTTKQPIKQTSTGPIDNNVKIMVNDVKIMVNNESHSSIFVALS